MLSINSSPTAAQSRVVHIILTTSTRIAMCNLLRKDGSRQQREAPERLLILKAVQHIFQAIQYNLQAVQYIFQAVQCTLQDQTLPARHQSSLSLLPRSCTQELAIGALKTAPPCPLLATTWPR
jgi:hypothetical protein